MVSPFLPEQEKLAAIREALPATGAGIYLNTGTCGPLPVEVARAMADLEAWELRVGRASYDYELETIDRMAEARAAVAAVVGAGLDEIALTHATSDGLNIATWSLDWKPRDRVVTARQFEHIGALGPLYTLRDRVGVELVMADIGDGGDRRAVLEALDRAIVPGTKLVSLSHVSWATGAILPIAEIARLAHDRGARIVVDGAQSAGAIPLDVAGLGVDYYAIPGQKWLLGPEGTGALYVAPDRIERALVTFSGYRAYESHDLVGSATPWPSARRFEGSSWHRPSVVGLARACGWLSMAVGLEWAHRRGLGLARATADRLARIPGVEVLTPRESMATLVTFRIAGWPAQAALDELGARVFAIARTLVDLDALRISVGWFNTEEELERFATCVELLAAHTPETLPARRTLAMLDEVGP